MTLSGILVVHYNLILEDTAKAAGNLYKVDSMERQVLQ